MGENSSLLGEDFSLIKFEMQNALNFTLYTPPLFLLKVGGEFQF